MKQNIEIEVPDGKKAIWENGMIKFVPKEPYWKEIITFEDAFIYVHNHLPECSNLIRSYAEAMPNSFEQNIARYRIVVAALTNNEKRHLTTGDKWHPVVQFCPPKNEENCYGKVLIGTIESEGERYSVVGGDAYGGSGGGLGAFYLTNGASRSYTTVGFRSVSSAEIAKHISIYFGKLLFDIHYGGVNCNYSWVEVVDHKNNSLIMIKEIKFNIDVPEGKRAVLKDNTIIFEDIKPQSPKTWEEFCKQNEIKKGECLINDYGDIKEISVGKRYEIIDKNVLPNKQAAEAHLALMQLHQLRDCYRQGWKPDWNNQKTIKVCIVQRFPGRYIIEPRDGFYPAFLSFKDNKTAKEFLKNFEDLIKQAGDLI